MKKVALAVMVWLACATSFVSAAEICEDLNDVANGWNEIANILSEREGDGLNEAESDKLDQVLDSVTGPTGEIAEALVGLGNDTESALGQKLHSFLTELDQRQRGDQVAYLVDVIDDVVDSIDAIVDYCDKVNQ